MASLSGSIVNLIKNIVGSGMLSLPLAIGLVSEIHPLHGIFMLWFSAFLNALAFYILGISSMRLVRKDSEILSLRQVFEKVFNPSYAWMIDIIIIINNLFACLAIVILLGDFAVKGSVIVLRQFGYSVEISRFFLVCLVGMFVVFPLTLCSLISNLKKSSVIGIMAMFYSFSYVVIDSLLHNENNIDDHDCSSGGFMRMTVGITEFKFLKSWAIFSTSYLCHYNVPRYVCELKNPTRKRIFSLVFTSFLVVVVIYSIFAWCGYKKFGLCNLTGDVLDSYDADSATVSLGFVWISMSANLACTFPIVFIAFKDSTRNLLSPQKHGIFSIISVFILILAGCVVSDVASVNFLKGSTTSLILSGILPSLIYLNLEKEKKNLDGLHARIIHGSDNCDDSKNQFNYDKILAWFNLIFASLLGFSSFIYLLDSLLFSQ